ncbi:TIGR00341 family protein [Sulfurospirillum sp. 1307]|jgi:uncharacterized hydrophobic protein (TIGR00271 family)
MYKNIFLVVSNVDDKDEYKVIFDYFKEKYNIKPELLSFREVLNKSDDDFYTSTNFMFYLSDDEMKLFLNNNLKYNLNISILPNDNCSNAIKAFDISSNLYEAIDDGLNCELLSSVDLLKCNDIIVFNKVIIGDMHGLNRIASSRSSFFQKALLFFHNLKGLQFKNYNFLISKEKKFHTVATGITILEQSLREDKDKIDDKLSIRDGKLNAFILAPTSLIAYLWYLILMFFYEKISIQKLPDGLGYIKSSRLIITSNESINLLIDDSLICSKELEFIVYKKIINLHLGRNLAKEVKLETDKGEIQDIINVKTLPKNELEDILIRGKLPFFKKASEEDFKELFTSLRNDAKISSVFITLIILSTLLATVGLFANSAPVIIGAMILAPLMSPIVSFSMGIIRGDKSLINRSIKTLFYGINIAIIFSAIFTLLIPIKEITPEMTSRLNPNLFDLMVAVFSGIAGAYASSKAEVAKSLAGVAIAVALVPPLSVTGIGIGMLDFKIIYGSFLLFITNLVGITLSAGFTFTVLGYSPVHKAKKAILYTSFMLFMISIPLYFSFVSLIEKNKYFNSLKSINIVHINSKKLEIKPLDIKSINNKLIIELKVLSSKTITDEEIRILKDMIEKKINKNIVLKASINLKIE